jgi:hypothetical protein
MVEPFRERRSRKMKKNIAVTVMLLATLAFATASFAEVVTPPTSTQTAEQMGAGKGTGPRDGSGSQMRKGKKDGSGSGERVQKRDGSCDGSGQGAKHGKGGQGRGRSGGRQ